MKTASKAAIIIMASVIFLFFPTTNQAQKNLFDSQLSFIPIGMSITAPEFFRNVPRHPEDNVYTVMGPISQEVYTVHGTFAFSVLFRHQLTEGISYGAGLRFDWHSVALAERNYTNAPGTTNRDIGAALTFCGLTTRGILPPSLGDKYDDLSTWGMTPVLTIEAPLCRKLFGLYPKLAVSFSYQALVGTNGWDRYGELEYQNSATLINLFPVDVSLKFKIYSVNLEVGNRFFLSSKTALGKEFGINMSQLNLFAAVSMEEIIKSALK